MTISDVSALRDWRAAVRDLRFPSALPAVEFALPSLPDGDNRRLTLEALRLSRACGCTAAGLSMTVAILLVSLRLAGGEAGLGAVPVLQWLQYFAFVVGAAALGKLAGLLWARRRMVQLADAIQRLAGPAPAASRTD